MVEKNSFWRKAVAFLLSVVIIVLVFPTTFSAPLEFIVLKNDTYSTMLKSDEFLEIGQEAFSFFIADQLNQPSENEMVPPIFTDTEMIAEVIKPYVTKEWVQDSLTSGMQQLLEFLNFKKPFGIINIDLTELKENTLAGRSDLAENILSHFASCDEQEIKALTSGTGIIANLPACNPPQEMKEMAISVISTYIEEFTYQIPQQYSINVEDAVQAGLEDPLLSYSFFRWTFRLLPILTLVLLILVAICLKKNTHEMRSWIGKLLITAAVVSLVLILTLLIGSEQFTTVLVNNALSADQEAFGTLLLKILQSITNQSLLWMAAIAAALLVVGLLIHFINRIGRKKDEDITDQEEALEEPLEDMLEAKREMIEGTTEEETEE